MVSFLNFSGFVAVVTPHFAEQLTARYNLMAGLNFTSSIIHRIWNAAPIGRVAAAKIGNAFVYVRKVRNERRMRWELEFISFTPSTFLHTKNNNDAVLINI